MNHKDRFLQENFDYYRITILDFFPLDDWVVKILDFLVNNFDSILDDISEIPKLNRALSSYNCEDESLQKESSYEEKMV